MLEAVIIFSVLGLIWCLAAFYRINLTYDVRMHLIEHTNMWKWEDVVQPDGSILTVERNNLYRILPEYGDMVYKTKYYHLWTLKAWLKYLDELHQYKYPEGYRVISKG